MYGKCVSSDVLCDKCTTCINNTTCLQCDKGYFLYKGYCTRCRDACAECAGYDCCTKCPPGKYGRLCELYCYVGVCENNECDIDNGICLKRRDCFKCVGKCDNNVCDKCNDGFYLRSGECYPCILNCGTCVAEYNCTTCTPRRFGNACQYVDRCSEPPICRNKACTEEGYCLEGCTDGYYSGIIENTEFMGCIECLTLCTKCKNEYDCTACMPGHFCRLCELSCNENHYVDGDHCRPCSPNCKGCGTNTECNKCFRDSFWGTHCEKTCTNCLDSRCSLTSGVCNKGCVDGYYTRTCSMSCSDGCVGGVCYQDSGTCSHGCQDNWTGPTCSERHSIAVEIILSTIAVFVVVLVLVAVAVICHRRRCKGSSDSDEGSLINTGVNSTEVHVEDPGSPTNNPDTEELGHHYDRIPLQRQVSNSQPAEPDVETQDASNSHDGSGANVVRDGIVTSDDNVRGGEQFDKNNQIAVDNPVATHHITGVDNEAHNSHVTIYNQGTSIQCQGQSNGEDLVDAVENGSNIEAAKHNKHNDKQETVTVDIQPISKDTTNAQVVIETRDNVVTEHFEVSGQENDAHLNKNSIPDLMESDKNFSSNNTVDGGYVRGGLSSNKE